MINLLHAIFYVPLYNGLVFLIDTLPGVEAGIIVILFTAIVKLALFPLSRKAVIAQLKIKKIDPQIKEIRAKITDKQEQARAMLDLYKQEGINPFSGVVLILIQIPIVFSLYFIFRNGFPTIDASLLYSFVGDPGVVRPLLFNSIDISQKSIILAITAGVSSFLQIRYSIPPIKQVAQGERTLKDDFARSMNMQMRYGMPVIILITGYVVGGAVALYWTTSNLFTLGQELYLRKRVKSKHNEPSDEPARR